MSTDTPAPKAGAVFAAIETQRSRLINVMGVVQCMRLACRAAGQEGPEEIESALELLGDEIQRVVTALEGPQLERAAELGEADPLN